MSSLLQHTFRSSNLEYGVYDSTTQRLWIQFVGGATYAYDGVPLYIWNELVGASSAGKYFHQTIKQGGYPYRRSTPGDWGN